MSIDIEIELRSIHGELKVLYIKNVEKLSSYIDRHKKIISTGIQILLFDLVLYKNPRENTFLIPPNCLSGIRIEKEQNDIRLFFNVTPFTEFTIHNYLNSDGIIKKIDIKYLDKFFEINYLHLKIRLIPPVKQTAKKRYSWFNK